MFRSYLLGFLHALTVFVRKWWLWMSSGRCLFFLELFKLTPCCFLCFYRFFFYFHPFIQQFLFNCQLRFSSKETNNFISIFKSCIVKGICLFEDLIFENLIFENREGISLFGERIFQPFPPMNHALRRTGRHWKIQRLSPKSLRKNPFEINFFLLFTLSFLPHVSLNKAPAAAVLFFASILPTLPSRAGPPATSACWKFSRICCDTFAPLLWCHVSLEKFLWVLLLATPCQKLAANFCFHQPGANLNKSVLKFFTFSKKQNRLLSFRFTSLIQFK